METFTEQGAMESTAGVRIDKRVLAATLGAALLLLAILELHSPYFFLQDDNLEYYFPAYFHNWRSLLGGQFALYNFHTFAGVPHAAAGQLATFYPLPYLAIGLSQMIWGHPFAAMDLLAIMHGLLAVAGGFVLLRQLKASNLVAAFGALTALSAYFIWCGEMWSIVPVLCAWFPWMIYSSLRFLEEPSAGKAALLVFFRVVLLYGGHPQFFVLAVIFEHVFALTYVWLMKPEGRARRYGQYLALNVPVSLLGLPFLLPVTVEMNRSLQRSQPLPYWSFASLKLAPHRWFVGQFLPFNSIVRVLYRQQGDNIEIGDSLPFISHIGYLPSLLSLGTIMLWWKRPKDRRVMVAASVAFLIALGWTWNAFGHVIYHLPILNRFRWPFKVEYFAGFFQCLLASLVLGLFAKRWQRLAIAGFVANWLIIFCVLPNHGWRVRSQRIPLQSPWVQELRDGRYAVFSDSPLAGVTRQYVEFNYSMVWGLDNLLGYNPMLPALNASITSRVASRDTDVLMVYRGVFEGPINADVLSGLRRLSTRYVLLGPKRTEYRAVLAGAGFKERGNKSGWTLWEDPNVLGRVHWSALEGGADSAKGITWTSDANSIHVSLSQWPDRELTIAYAANPDLRACLGDACRAVSSGADGLIHLAIPPGTRSVRLVYQNRSMLHGCVIAIASLLVMAAAWGYVRFRSGVARS